MNILPAAFLGFATLTAAVGLAENAYACGSEAQAVRSVTIEEAQKAKPTFVDVNSPKTRASMGVIPGALLVSSYKEPVKDLPENKDESLVFYCASTQCGASKKAATTAMNAGYSKVAVLPVGIKGWKEAGMKTAAPAKKKNS